MILIFGNKSTMDKVPEASTCHCLKCQVMASWNAIKETEWVSFFFIPTLPVKSTCWLACSSCGTKVPISTRQFGFIKKASKTGDLKESLLQESIAETIVSTQLGGKAKKQKEFI